jgi:hypothetical protein
MFTEPLPSNDRVYNRPINFSLIHDGPYRKYAFNISSIVTCIRFRENVLTESLPSNDTHVNTH